MYKGHQHASSTKWQIKVFIVSIDEPKIDMKAGMGTVLGDKNRLTTYYMPRHSRNTRNKKAGRP